MALIVEMVRASLRVGLQTLVDGVSLRICSGQVWALVGGNGSGKTALAELLAGQREPSSGEVNFAAGVSPADAQLLSFEEQFRIMARERRDDESWLMQGAPDPGTTVQQFVSGAAPDAERDGERVARLLVRFRLGHRADTGLKFLSTGEVRKAILCRAVAARPKLLILDEPYDGLDAAAQIELRALIRDLAGDSRAVVLVLSREAHLSPEVGTITRMVGGRVFGSDTAGGSQPGSAPAEPTTPPARLPPIPGRIQPGGVGAGEPLVHMRDVSVDYGDRPILRHISWTARAGESWHIVGPNGAGKTTLLSLVNGDNAKAYGQDIWLFGRRRGSGESIWEIKQNIGTVSGDFHGRYPLRTTALDAVLSGFTDSAGLYETPAGYERQLATAWLKIIGLVTKSHVQLRRLSYGEQRAVLVARAMVKMPPLMIADEPCQGLDDTHTELVMALLDRIGRETETCVLYVSHDSNLKLPSTTHRLVLRPGERGSSAATESLSSPA